MRQERIARLTVTGFVCLVAVSVGGCGSDHEGGDHTVPSGSAGTNGQDPIGNGTGGSGAGSGTGNAGNAGNAGNGSGAQTGFFPGGAAHVRLVLKEVH
jgi:hypothetical protein